MWKSPVVCEILSLSYLSYTCICNFPLDLKNIKVSCKR
uniref:Uncharacterized protein n=1 Tax=Anguilla anguilla TaxID=7936 RepID=A0A0E9SCE0_ANGAN